MKELSIEEKAKAYDEAIKKAESLYKAAEPMSGCNVIIETLFPELKESKDERIINLIKMVVKKWHNVGYADYVMDIPKSDIITWLEKQDEQKPMTIQIGKSYKCIGSPRYTCFIIGDVYKPCDEYLCSLMNLCSDCFEPIEDEQKPADETPYPETLEKAIDLYYYSYGNGEGEFEHLSLEKFRDIVHTFVSDYGQKSSLNEEDERHIDTITSLLEARKKEQSDWMVEVLNEEIHWLKSLRPQNRWKPSDEQMKALWEVYKGGEEQTALASLYSDLKKLKKE